MSSSVGSASTRARNAGSRLSSRSTAGQRVERRRGIGRRAVAHHRDQHVLASARPASHRLKRVGVMGQQEGAFGAAVARSRITGAEKPRRIEGTGRAASPSKVKLCSRLGQLQHAWSAPPRRRWGSAGPRRPGSPAAPCRAGPAWAAWSAAGSGCRCRRRQSSFTVSARRAGLRVPALELRQVAAGGILEHLAASPRSSPPRRRGGRSRGPAPCDSLRPRPAA